VPTRASACNWRSEADLLDIHQVASPAGKFYWFAVTAIGTAGESSKSEPCRVMAAA
jgi:hypothetical protein